MPRGRKAVHASPTGFLNAKRRVIYHTATGKYYAKAEGGKLTVKAEIVHGKLQVTVADTGLGFGRAATSGTGVGLANIRERLTLLYGKIGRAHV